MPVETTASPDPAPRKPGPREPAPHRPGPREPVSERPASQGVVSRGGPVSQRPGSPEPGAPPTAYPGTRRTTPTRLPQRASYDRELVHSILDATYLCHLGFVTDGTPVVLPTLFARVGEHLYLHGSTGSRPLRASGPPGPREGAGAARPDARTSTGDPVRASTETDTGLDTDPESDATPDSGADAGLPVCVTVTLVDGIVLARSAFHHSINYRSVVVHGIAHQVTDPDERSAALDALVDHVVPGRAGDSRRANPKELAATAVIRLDLHEVSAKVRSGGPGDEPEDVSLPHWSGVLPVTSGLGIPVPADDLDPAVRLPDYLCTPNGNGAHRRSGTAHRERHSPGA